MTERFSKLWAEIYCLDQQVSTWLAIAAVKEEWDMVRHLIQVKYHVQSIFEVLLEFDRSELEGDDKEGSQHAPF